MTHQSNLLAGLDLERNVLDDGRKRWRVGEDELLDDDAAGVGGPDRRRAVGLDDSRRFLGDVEELRNALDSCEKKGSGIKARDQGDRRLAVEVDFERRDVPTEPWEEKGTLARAITGEKDSRAHSIQLGPKTEPM